MLPLWLLSPQPASSGVKDVGLGVAPLVLGTVLWGGCGAELAPSSPDVQR